MEQRLKSQINEGNVVLFLGAAASYGAPSRDGAKKIPTTETLKELVSEKFLDGDYKSGTFQFVFDLAASEASELEVQEFIHNTLIDFYPANYHKLIPKIKWSGIITTNYDLIIERVYESDQDRSQDVIAFRLDADDALSKKQANNIIYNKLHGCITQYRVVNPPLIASTEQFIRHKEGRYQQFAEFQEIAKSKPIVFAGYSMTDPNIRSIMSEIMDLGDKRPRHYLVSPDLTDREIRYWSERRIQGLKLTFEEFLKQASHSISPFAAATSAIEKSPNDTTLHKHINARGRTESAELNRYLALKCTHVRPDMETGTAEPAKFYSGFSNTWFPYPNNFDVRRKIVEEILEQKIIAAGQATSKFVIIKSHAGGGKTVALRRLAWDAAERGEICLLLDDASSIELAIFHEIFELTSNRVILFIDDVTEGSENLDRLLQWAKSRSKPLLVVGAARYNEWNVRCESLSVKLDAEYELTYLDHAEINSLVNKLRENNCLGSMADLSQSDAISRIKQEHGRQLLVALHEATHNRTFSDIIEDEYRGIQPPEAQILYRDVCAINRLGPPVRAGFIARVHGVAFEEFRDRFFSPLEHVVESFKDKRTGDWVYQARHPYIAEMVYRASLPTTLDKFENLKSIIGKLNPGYSYDNQVIISLTRGSSLSELFPEISMGLEIYKIVLESTGENGFILQQRAIYRMRLAGDTSELDKAEEDLLRASELVSSSSVRHSMAELSLKRASIASDSLSRLAWLRKAEAQASALVRTATSSHPFHTLAKAAVQEVEVALERCNGGEDLLAFDALNEAIKKAEEAVTKGLQKYPTDGHLLNEQANLNELLEKDDAVLGPLVKAFKNNPSSELLCRRLTTVYLSKSMIPQAFDTLKIGLDNNPGSQQLNYMMAKALVQHDAMADTDKINSVAFHLRRSFSRGDKKYDAQFLFARTLFLQGAYGESEIAFRELKAAQMPFDQKRKLRFPVRDSNGTPRKYYGRVRVRSPSWGFIRTDSGIDIFFGNQATESDIGADDRVEFDIAFSLLGPGATYVKKVGWT